MLFASWITKIIFGTFLNEDSKFQSLLLILAVAGIGALVYGYLALKIRLAEKTTRTRNSAFTTQIKNKNSEWEEQNQCSFEMGETHAFR